MPRTPTVPRSLRQATLHAALCGVTASLLLCGCVSPRFDPTTTTDRTSDGAVQDAQSAVGADAQQADAQQSERADATTGINTNRDAGNLTGTPAACVVGQSKLSDCILR